MNSTARQSAALAPTFDDPELPHLLRRYARCLAAASCDTKPGHPLQHGESLGPIQAPLAELWPLRLSSLEKALEQDSLEEHFERLSARGAELAANRIPFEQIVLATHLQERAALPHLVAESRSSEDLLRLLTAADALSHWELARLAVAFQETEHRELLKANAELERLNEFKSDFLSACSHDLRSPMLSIIAAARRLLGQQTGQNASIDTAIVEDIRRRAEDALALIDNILHLSAAQSGRLPLHPERMDLRDLLRDQVAAHRYLADERQIRLVYIDEPDVLPVHADSVQLARVFRNILHNALKFTPSGGRISVRTMPEPDRFRVIVHDTGPGIPEEDLATIFERYTVGTAQHSPGKGTGLGLAVAREIVHLHGGQIEFYARSRAGATVIVTLPVAADEPDCSKPTP